MILQERFWLICDVLDTTGSHNMRSQTTTAIKLPCVYQSSKAEPTAGFNHCRRKAMASKDTTTISNTHETYRYYEICSTYRSDPHLATHQSNYRCSLITSSPAWLYSTAGGENSERNGTSFLNWYHISQWSIQTRRLKSKIRAGQQVETAGAAAVRISTMMYHLDAPCDTWRDDSTRIQEE